MKAITWKTVSVEVKKIKPTPNNYKLITEDGSARFNTSVDNFGLAGTVILNADYTLIDGNTRLDKAKKMKLKKIDASMPSRKLTPKEFKEFSAMYDMARAGEVDILRIKEELGTTDSFFKKWGFELPQKSLDKLEELERLDKSKPEAVKMSAKEIKELETRPITLMFTTKECTEYLRLAEALYKKHGVDNVTDLSLAVLRKAK